MPYELSRTNGIHAPRHHAQLHKQQNAGGPFCMGSVHPVSDAATLPVAAWENFTAFSAAARAA